MEVPLPVSSSSPQLSVRHSRRSFPNLTHLSLAPLSSKFPIDESEGTTEAPPRRSLDDGIEQRDLMQRRKGNKMHIGLSRSGHSYVEGRSAPVTPSILSRSTSPVGTPRLQHSRSHRHRKRAAPAATPAAPSTGTTSAAKDKPLKTPGANPTSTNGDEWLHRAGLTIAMQAVENKGQSWLVSRASSTSLVQLQSNASAPPALGDDEATNDGPTFSHKHSTSIGSVSGFGSRFGSRAASRAASRHTSRRGSRASGTRPDLGMTPFTALATVGDGSLVRTPMRASYESSLRDGYFGGEEYDLTANLGAYGDETPAEADFVDQRALDEEYISGQLEEEEVRRLAAERGFGLGAWMDRLIGWTLFKVEEDGGESDDDEAKGEGVEEDEDEELRRAVREAKREAEERRRDRGKVRVMQPPVSLRDKVEVPQPPMGEGEEVQGGGGWKDAAWLLSVASKVVL